ncbi:hypothetical protein [Permianibacter aggregans]|uniref:Uncharacterized protein n=1 Tax=Permianibacter aggregans TaxID=1510150 RepID=A0A4R6URC7_9GAMM|nr:hypothetical protein [Permianibacter aggregans]QGX39444.1 hypothetical protein E2H98_07125 [Permianibacter aggregans]TDQ49820.1 hypothetical protein EV696_103192 [Permianibacter aggregans]
MGKKSEERIARKAQKLLQFEKSKEKQLEKVHNLERPKIVVNVDDTKQPHIAPSVNENVTNTPKAAKDGSRYGELVTWCITGADKEGKWSWHEPREWSNEEWDNDIAPSFQEFARKTWAEIDHLSSGSSHKMHHDQDVASLIKEARRRWRKLGLEQFDTAFRFRLGGTKRAWGYIVQAHFFLVWWERHHKLYPVNK